MEKFLNILSELTITEEYISTEIDEIKSWTNHVFESTTAYKRGCDDVKQNIQQISTLTKEKKMLYEKINDKEKTFAVTQRKFVDLQKQHEILKICDDNYFGLSEDNAFQMEYKMELFGINVKAHYIEPTVYQANISFQEGKYVIFKCDTVQNVYYLQAIEPNQTNFKEMQKLLLKCGDIVGFMCHIRKLFVRTN